VSSDAYGAHWTSSAISHNVLLPVSSSSDRSGLQSATTAQYVKPKLGTVFGERPFSFAGPKSSNDLSSLLHIFTSTDYLKRQLKTYLFDTLSYNVL